MKKKSLIVIKRLKTKVSGGLNKLWNFVACAKNLIFLMNELHEDKECTST